MSHPLDEVPSEILSLILLQCEPWSVYQLLNTCKAFRLALKDGLPGFLRTCLVEVFFPLEKELQTDTEDCETLLEKIHTQMSNVKHISLQEAVYLSSSLKITRNADLPLKVHQDAMIHPDAELAIGKSHSWIGVDYEPPQDSHLFALPTNGLFAIYEVSYQTGIVKLLHLSDQDSWWPSSVGWLVSKNAEWKLDFNVDNIPQCSSHHEYHIEAVRCGRKTTTVHRRKWFSGELGPPQQVTFEVSRKYEVDKKWWNFNDRFSIAMLVPRMETDTHSRLYLVNWETLETQFLVGASITDANYFQFERNHVYMNDASLKLRVINKGGSLQWYVANSNSELTINRYYPDWEIATGTHKTKWTPNGNAKYVFGTLHGVPQLWSFGWELNEYIGSEAISLAPKWKRGDDWEGWQARINMEKIERIASQLALEGQDTNHER